MRLFAAPGVFRPRSDSLLLARTAASHVDETTKALDLFTGSGVVALTVAGAGARETTATDVSRRAVAGVWLNARLRGLALRARRGDLFAPVAGERFDLITANPPYVPGVDPRAARGAARAWEAGGNGRALIDRLCESAADHLEEGGRLLLVQSSICDEEETLRMLADRGLRSRVAERRRGPLGPLMKARSEELERRGMLAGASEEDVVLIEALAPARRAGGRVRVTPYRNGPYLLRGEFELLDQSGEPIPTQRQTVALCRCGASRSKPFCDGSHKLVAFNADSGPAVASD